MEDLSVERKNKGANLVKMKIVARIQMETEWKEGVRSNSKG